MKKIFFLIWFFLILVFAGTGCASTQEYGKMVWGTLQEKNQHVRPNYSEDWADRMGFGRGGRPSEFSLIEEYREKKRKTKEFAREQKDKIKNKLEHQLIYIYSENSGERGNTCQQVIPRNTQGIMELSPKNINSSFGGIVVKPNDVKLIGQVWLKPGVNYRILVRWEKGSQKFHTIENFRIFPGTEEKFFNFQPPAGCWGKGWNQPPRFFR